MPLLGVAFYFSKSPRYIPAQIIQASLFPFNYLTIILPILFILLLKTLKKANSIYLKLQRENVLSL